MKDKVMDALQRFSKATFIPVLILPIAGILIAVGNLFTNVRLQAVLPFLNNPVNRLRHAAVRFAQRHPGQSGRYLLRGPQRGPGQQEKV